MQGQIHVNDEGVADRCGAKTPNGCPFRIEGYGDNGHFSTYEDARANAEAIVKARHEAQSKKSDGKLRKKEKEEHIAGDRRVYPGGDIGEHHWLKINGKVVGYINTLYDPNDNEKLTLCDIQVRPEYQGRGYAKLMIQNVEKQYGATMYTTGSFSQAGAKAFSGKMPLLRGAEEHVDSPDEPEMNFVYDWDKAEPMFRL